MYELTTQQENIWKLQSYYEDTSISNITGILHFKEQLDLETLKRAINLYVKYQEGARLRFVRNGSKVHQFITDYVEFDIPVKCFDNLEEMRKFANIEARIPYQFGKNGESSDCMYRITIYQTKNQCGIIIDMNHLISDAWTLSLFCKSIIEYYLMLSGRKKDKYSTFSYIDYVKKEKQYIHSDKYQKDKEYWENKFLEIPVRKRIKPEGKENAGVASFRLTYRMEEDKALRIRDFCDKLGYSPAILFESVIFTYLTRINEPGKETMIGVPVLNRTGKDKNIAGMFISTMPLGIEVNSDDTMTEVCKKVSVAHFELFRHQKFPYSNILKYVRHQHGFEGNLYDVMVSYQNAVVGESDKLENETEWLCNGYSEIPMAFHIDDRDESGSFTINMDVQEEVFSKEEAELLLHRILYMVDVVSQNGEISVEQMPIMPEEEYDMVVHQFNNTKVLYDSSLCAHEVFEKQAKIHSDKVALICDGDRLTYKELSEKTTKLAHYLRSKNVRRGDIVPIISTRSAHAIIAMLGIMKAGGAYLPVDYQYPIERVQYMIEESGAGMILICGEKSKQLAEKLNIDYVDLKEVDYEKITERTIDNINLPDDKAYVIFTSGSTGKPKGTVLKHKGLVNFCLPDELGIAKDSVFQHCVFQHCNTVLAIGSFSFDISLVEIFLPLLNGLSVILATESQVNEADCLVRLMIENRIDVIHTTPTRMSYFMESDKFVKSMSGLKTILVAGESLPQDLHKRIINATDARLFNGYGPTETTIGATFARMDNKKSVTIGKPIANTQIYVVDHDRNLCPIGVAGELCISGNGVGEGYLNRPELTSEKFVPNPFATKENGYGERMYRTGDLARWTEDGELEFLGRIDTQVKIRGLRIELGEIENRLLEYNGVEQCAVTDKKDNNGRQILVGYYTSKIEMNEKELRKYMLTVLPNYMVPNYFMKLEHIPTNISGKTDRKNLPMPDLSSCDREYIPPNTETEKLLCKVYQKVLDVEQVGRTDDFFELGGDSLTAMSLISEIADYYSDISLQWIFEHPIVMELAELIDNMHISNNEDGKNGWMQSTELAENTYNKYQHKLHTILNERKNILSPNECFGSVEKEKSMQSAKNGVILTGATGFLGAHILKNILDEGQNEIFCIVRANNCEDAKKRLVNVLGGYFDNKYADRIQREKNIHVIAGNIAESDVDAMIRQIQTVRNDDVIITHLIHTAALVKHYGTYDEFEKTNVIGTKHMIELSDKLGAELIHISTESVGGICVDGNRNNTDGTISYTEEDIYIGQNLDNVYIRSKFEAECSVIDFVEKGGKARIIRVGNLTNRYCDGVFQKNYSENAFLRRMKTFLSLGVYPDVLKDSLIEFSPIDETARAIMTIVFCKKTKDMLIYHASHVQKMTYEHLKNLLQNIGKSLTPVDIDVFVDMLQAGNTSHDYVRNDLIEMKKMIKSDAIPVIPVNEKTTMELKTNGFEWKEIDETYIQNYVDYLEKIEM